MGKFSASAEGKGSTSFLKKEAKTLVILVPHAEHPTLKSQKFFGSFFNKEQLSSFVIDGCFVTGQRRQAQAVLDKK